MWYMLIVQYSLIKMIDVTPLIWNRNASEINVLLLLVLNLFMFGDETNSMVSIVTIISSYNYNYRCWFVV